MDESSLRDHLARAANGADALGARLAAAVWPAGGTDRHEPAAAGWLARWRPARNHGAVPACGCASGPCPVCN